MNDLKKLGLTLSASVIAALTLGACGGDDSRPENAAGSSSAGSSAAGTTASAAAGSSSDAGASSAGKGTAGAATAGDGGGASGGSIGENGGAGAASAGSANASGGAPSAECSKWCSGDTGLVERCTGGDLLNPVVNTEQKCLDYCARPSSAAGMQCWLDHLQFVMSPQDPHCGHASGMPGAASGGCTEIHADGQ